MLFEIKKIDFICNKIEYIIDTSNKKTKYEIINELILLFNCINYFWIKKERKNE